MRRLSSASLWWTPRAGYSEARCAWDFLFFAFTHRERSVLLHYCVYSGGCITPVHTLNMCYYLLVLSFFSVASLLSNTPAFVLTFPFQYMKPIILTTRAFLFPCETNKQHTNKRTELGLKPRQAQPFRESGHQPRAVRSKASGHNLQHPGTPFFGQMPH